MKEFYTKNNREEELFQALPLTYLFKDGIEDPMLDQFINEQTIEKEGWNEKDQSDNH
jgi:hypothetical protein